MEIVFSAWYIVAALLIVAMATCLVLFFVMNRKDAKLTEEFVKKEYANNQKLKEKKEEN